MGFGLPGSLQSYMHYIIYYMYISLANKIALVVFAKLDVNLGERMLMSTGAQVQKNGRQKTDLCDLNHIFFSAPNYFI